MNLIRLLSTSGPAAGSLTGIRPAERLVVGRSQECDLPVVDPWMSRFHFVLEQECGRWVIADLQSKNGTRVNGTLANHSIVGPGDVIAAGGSRFEVVLDDGTNLAPSPDPASQAVTSTSPLLRVCSQLSLGSCRRRGPMPGEPCRASWSNLKSCTPGWVLRHCRASPASSLADEFE